MAANFADEQLAAYPAQPPEKSTSLDVAEMRQAGRRRAALRDPGLELPAVEAIRIGAIAARLYNPSLSPLPLVVYAHGGGWTIGDLGTHDRVCRRLAQAPAPPSSRSTTGSLQCTLASRCRRRRAGTSLGRRLTARTRHNTQIRRDRRRQRRRNPRHTVLPAAAHRGPAIASCPASSDLPEHPPVSQPSMRAKATGFGLTTDGVRFFNSQWVPDRSRWADPEISPLFTPDLSGMPTP